MNTLYIIISFALGSMFGFFLSALFYVSKRELKGESRNIIGLVGAVCYQKQDKNGEI